MGESDKGGRVWWGRYCVMERQGEVRGGDKGGRVRCEWGGGSRRQ